MYVLFNLELYAGTVILQKSGTFWHHTRNVNKTENSFSVFVKCNLEIWESLGEVRS